MILNAEETDTCLRKLWATLHCAGADNANHPMRLTVAEWLELVTMIDDLHETLRRWMRKPDAGEEG